MTLRKEYPVLALGKLTHFYPMDNVYVLQKTYNDKKAIIIITAGDERHQVHTTQLKIFLPGGNQLRNIITNEIIDLNSNEVIQFDDNSAEIFIVEN